MARTFLIRGMICGLVAEEIRVQRPARQAAVNAI